ncbi:ribonuclease P protein subunit p20-like isoform X2 [Oscarella lobularis]|uniref:ribonuclease P protein subunit p20-like isoform X2 n=1 Tax=Oscarella lobularis TaxID=121494 RepID=UPI003313A285
MASAPPVKGKHYSHHKRTPRRQSTETRNDVYVSRSSNFKLQLERCEALLDKEFDEIVIHGLGAAVNRAIHLALQLEERGAGKRAVSASTSTVELVDDFEAEDEEGYSYSETRNNSSISIRVLNRPAKVTEAVSVTESRKGAGVLETGQDVGKETVALKDVVGSRGSSRRKSSKSIETMKSS